MKVFNSKTVTIVLLISLAVVAVVFWRRSVVLGNYLTEITTGINNSIDQESSLNTAKYLNKNEDQIIEKDLQILGSLRTEDLVNTTNITNSDLISSNRISAVSLSVDTIDTGNGSTEVYLMNQNLRSIDSPTFSSLNVSSDLTTYNLILTTGLTCSNCITLGTETEGAYVANITSGNSDISVSGLPGEGFSPTITLISTLQSLTLRGATTTNPITLNITDGSDALVLSTSSVINLAQSSAPSTTTDRLYNVAGNLVFNGVALTGGGGILPVGLNTYTLRHNGTGWVNATNLLNDGTNVGIGTAPSHKLHIVDTSTTVSRAGLYVSQTGAIVGTGYAGYFSKTGAGTTNVAGYFSASGATNNYGLIVENGNVGIGTISPGNLLTVTAPTTADSTTDVIIGITATTQTGLVIQGVASQSVNLQEWQGSNGNIAFATGDGLAGSEYIFNEQGLDIDFRWEASGADPALFIQGSDGNVGIGESTPQTALHLKATDSVNLRLEASDTTLTTDQVIGQIGFYTNDADVNGVGEKAWIRAYSADATGNRTKLGFATRNHQGTSGVEYMTLDETGKLGIGGTTPAAQVSVYTATDAATSVGSYALELQNNNASANTGAGIAFTRTGTTNFWRLKGENAGGTHYFKIGYYDGAVLTDHLSIAQSTGYVGIGDPTPDYMLDVEVGVDGDVAGFTDISGTCTINPTATALQCASDIRLKKDITNIDNALSIVDQLQGVNFRWKNQTSTTPRYGFIAQEMEKVLPALVSESADGYKKVSTTNLIPIMLEAIKELNDRDVGLSIVYNYDKLVTFTEGIRLDSDSIRPVCDVSSRGEIWFSKTADEEDDKLEVCLKNSENAYEWRITSSP